MSTRDVYAEARALGWERANGYWWDYDTDRPPAEESCGGWATYHTGPTPIVYPTEAEALAAAIDHHAATSGTRKGHAEARALGWDVYPEEADQIAASIDHYAASSGITTGETTMRKPYTTERVSETAAMPTDLDLVDDLDKTVDVARLLPGLLALAKDVSVALADGRITIGEILRIGRSLVRLVQDVRR